MSGRKSKGNISYPANVGEAPANFRVELGERIRWLLDQFDSRVQAAEVAGVTPEHLASYIAGRAKPPFELVARLAAAKDVSLDWIANGEGVRTTADAATPGTVAVPFVPDSEMPPGRLRDTVVFETAFLATLGIADAGRLRVVMQHGPANEPVIRDGDLLLVDTACDRIARDGIYVILRDGRHFVRFVETAPSGTVSLKSRNPDYGSQTLAPGEAAVLAILGRVLWRSGTM